MNLIKILLIAAIAHACPEALAKKTNPNDTMAMVHNTMTDTEYLYAPNFTTPPSTLWKEKNQELTERYGKGTRALGPHSALGRQVGMVYDTHEGYYVQLIRTFTNEGTVASIRMQKSTSPEIGMPTYNTVHNPFGVYENPAFHGGFCMAYSAAAILRYQGLPVTDEEVAHCIGRVGRDNVWTEGTPDKPVELMRLKKSGIMIKPVNNLAQELESAGKQKRLLWISLSAEGMAYRDLPPDVDKRSVTPREDSDGHAFIATNYDRKTDTVTYVDYQRVGTFKLAAMSPYLGEAYDIRPTSVKPSVDRTGVPVKPIPLDALDKAKPACVSTTVPKKVTPIEAPLISPPKETLAKMATTLRGGAMQFGTLRSDDTTD